VTISDLDLPFEPVMSCYGACIRCGQTFEFDPDLVPSARVHPATRCPVRPDGTMVGPGDSDGVREPLCVPCAALFRRAKGSDRPVDELFPHARTDLIDVAAARRIQGGAR
jgi:hypothetical protein